MSFHFPGSGTSVFTVNKQIVRIVTSEES